MTNRTRKTRRWVGGIILILAGVLINPFGPLLLAYLFDMPPDYFERGVNTVGTLLMVAGLAVLASPWLSDMLGSARTTRREDARFQELQQAIQRQMEEPQKAKPAWDLARIRLEQYFDRNLSQINYIFWLSVLVMLVGFGFILYGISVSFVSQASQQANPSGTGQEATIPTQVNPIAPAAVGVIAGIITEFIGATFLFVYRSTIQQAGTYVQTLENINSVGMAMQILDTISPDSTKLQDETKAQIVASLLSGTSLQLPERDTAGEQ